MLTQRREEKSAPAHGRERGRERERTLERDRERETERQRQRDRETDREAPREREREWERDREGESPLAPLFICFPLPLSLPCANWASQECCLFYLKSSLQSSYLPLTFLCSIFTGFSLPCLLATTIWDSYFLF